MSCRGRHTQGEKTKLGHMETTRVVLSPRDDESHEVGDDDP